MKRFRNAGVAAMAALMAIAPGAALALSRAWVSVVKGVDAADCGPAAKPCRTFQKAHDLLDSGGEIDVMDPGGYGALVITKPISVVNDGVGTAGIFVATGDAITIVTPAAPPVKVLLKGLSIDGGGTSITGVIMSNPANVTIVNCIIKGFGGELGAGVYVEKGPATLDIYDSRITTARDSGVWIAPTEGAVVATVRRTALENNGVAGLLVQDSLGGAASRVVIEDSVAAYNKVGVWLAGLADSRLVADRLDSSFNKENGVRVYTGLVEVSRSTIIGNGAGDLSTVAPNGTPNGTLISTKSNIFDTTGGTITPADLK